MPKEVKMIRYKKIQYVFVVVLVAAMLLYLWSVFGYKILKQIQISNHLKHKYGQEFIVEYPEYSGGGFGVDGVLSAEAYPKSDSNLKFIVKETQYGLSDYYPSSVWSRSELANVKKQLTDVRDDHDHDYDHDINVSVIVSAEQNILDSIRAPLPSYKEIVANNGTDVSYNIKISRGGDSVTDEDILAVQHIINYLNSQRIGFRSIIYSINSRNKKSEITCNLSGREIINVQDKAVVVRCFLKRNN